MTLCLEGLNREEQEITQTLGLTMRGHTSGVIGLVIKTEENGYFMFPSDAVYSKLNFGPSVVLPGLCVDPESYKVNIKRLAAMKEEYQAQMVFGHDVDDFAGWKQSPYFYE